MPTVEVLKHKIHYEQAGNAGLPILFIHGVPTSSVEWQAAQKLLSPYLQTYAIDLIGMGKSDKPIDGWDYTFKNDARIVEALMNEWGHEKMIVVGDDWGGGIALTVAAEYTDRTDLCVWMNSTSYDQWPVAEIESIARWDLLDEKMFSPLGNKVFDLQAQQFPMFFGLLLRTMVYRHANITARDMKAFREPYETVGYQKGGSLREGTAGYGSLKLDSIRALARRAASLDPKWMLDLPYEKITSPCMGLWGKEDVFMDYADLYRFKQDIKNAPVRLQTISEAGHLAMVDKPHEVADAILDFVTEYRGLDALAKPYMGFPELLGSGHLDDFDGFWKQ
jgi:pimeloyl-ACP methyl ester carboxylesterase